MAMVAKTFLTVTTTNAADGTHNSITIKSREVVPLQAYRRTEKRQNGSDYKFAMNIVPFRPHLSQQLTLPLIVHSSPEQLRFRLELRRLAYGAGMFALGILAHMAWLDAWS
jgi:hypothetical protein